MRRIIVTTVLVLTTTLGAPHDFISARGTPSKRAVHDASVDGAQARRLEAKQLWIRDGYNRTVTYQT